MKQQIVLEILNAPPVALDEFREDVQNSKLFSLDDLYVGIQWDDQVGFLTRRAYGEGEFFIAHPNAIGNGNWFNRLRGATVEEVIKTALILGVKVYRFSTEKELFTWLGQNL